MNIELNKDSNIFIYLQIMNCIKNKIIKKELYNGYKLPSERALSHKLGIHRNTVVKAYKMLVEEKFITISTKPKGYFVSYGDLNIDIEKSYLSMHYGPFEDNVRDEFLQMNALFSRLFHTSIEKKLVSFATAMPSMETYPKEELDQILIDLIQSDEKDIYGYSNPQGLLSLRKNICNILKEDSIQANPSEILVSSETYQSLDYLLKLFISPGDTIIVEEPINPDAFDLFHLLGTKVITIPMDTDGMIIDCLENLILKYTPKFIVTIPSFHNPSMCVMSMERRKKLLNISYKYNTPIIEINSDSILRYEGNQLPSLKSIDTIGTVIYLDSFIFRLAPGLKIAYIVTNKKIAKKLSKMLEINQIFLNTLSQHIVSEFIERGFYETNIAKLRDYYRIKRDFTVLCLEKYCKDYITFEIPEGGSSIWCKLRVKINQNDLLLKAEERGISFAPGHLFYPYGNEGDDFIRISYGVRTESEIEQGIRTLSDVLTLCGNLEESGDT